MTRNRVFIFVYRLPAGGVFLSSVGVGLYAPIPLSAEWIVAWAATFAVLYLVLFGCLIWRLRWRYF